MIVLGIDPGIAITGIALVEENHSKLNLIKSHEITTPAHTPLADRLLSLHTQLKNIIEELHPDVASLEELFFNTNSKTALIVGQARGVVQLTLKMNGVPLAEYTPLQVKMALTGWGRADKVQIQAMVKTILHLPRILKPDDVSDAAAIALTHCFSYKMKALS